MVIMKNNINIKSIYLKLLKGKYLLGRKYFIPKKMVAHHKRMRNIYLMKRKNNYYSWSRRLYTSIKRNQIHRKKMLMER